MSDKIHQNDALMVVLTPPVKRWVSDDPAIQAWLDAHQDSPLALAVVSGSLTVAEADRLSA